MALNVVREIDGCVAVRHVLMSVSDKSGLETFVPGLIAACPEVKSLDRRYLHRVRNCSAERRAIWWHLGLYRTAGVQGGLVKTHETSSLWACVRTTTRIQRDRRTDAVAIDMVVVNLYPFQQTVAREGVTPEEARTNIDIGGPCMVRASAKNYLRVASVTDPADYSALLDELTANGGTLGFATRLALMKKAFAHTAQYDTAIAAFFADVTEEQARKTYDMHA